MNQQSAAPSVQLSRFGWRDLGLWTAAAALVFGAHVAIAYGVQDFSLTDQADGGPPPAQVIEMSPMVVMPSAPEQATMLDTVQPDQAEPSEKPETVTEAEKPVTEPTPEPVTEEAEAAPSDPVEQAQPSVTEPTDQPPLDEVVPDIVQAVAPDVVIPLPQPKPEMPVEKKKPVEAKTKKPVDKPKPRQKKEKAEPTKTVATASAEVKSSAKAAAPKSTEASRSGDSSRWNSSLAAWIRRHTHYPNAARSRRVEGNVKVTFTIDSSGRVLSARMAGSSGDPDLDRAALAVLEGATVPAPPPELGSRVSRTAPFVFSLRN